MNEDLSEALEKLIRHEAHIERNERWNGYEIVVDEEETE